MEKKKYLIETASRIYSVLRKVTFYLFYTRKWSVKVEIPNTTFYFIVKRTHLQDSKMQRLLAVALSRYLALLSSYFAWLLVSRISRTWKCRLSLFSCIINNTSRRNDTRCIIHFFTKEVLCIAPWEEVTASGKISNPRIRRRESVFNPGLFSHMDRPAPCLTLKAYIPISLTINLSQRWMYEFMGLSTENRKSNYSCHFVSASSTGALCVGTEQNGQGTSLTLGTVLQHLRIQPVTFTTTTRLTWALP